jgi:hypothetical protein
MCKEHQPNESLGSQEPLQPNQLPPDLAQFLAAQELACVTHATDRGTVLVIKAPAHEIDSVRGRVPILLRHELYAHPSAPVIRMLLTICDQPRQPLAQETFINVEDPIQRTDFAALANQRRLPLLFYDEQLQHRLSKAIRAPEPAGILQVLERADRLLAAIPRPQFSFERAKESVLRQTGL